MKNLIIALTLLFSSLSYAVANQPTMVCKIGDIREIRIYGPLGYFYQNDIKQTSEISFPNRVELLIKEEVVNTLLNSTSMVNEKNEYTIMSYVLGVKDLTLKKVLNIFFRSDKGEVAHLDINAENFSYRGRGYCHLIH